MFNNRLTIFHFHYNLSPLFFFVITLSAEKKMISAGVYGGANEIDEVAAYSHLIVNYLVYRKRCVGVVYVHKPAHSLRTGPSHLFTLD